jgi:CheY-like chemotaxis protein
VARIALASPDLLFGSKVAGGLGAAGHEVARLAPDGEARSGVGRADLLVVDLTVEDYDGVGLVESLRHRGELGATPVLGYYAHVDQEVRRRAEGAGFDLVVPRSRMAREMATLVERLLAGGAGSRAEHT